MYNPQPAVAAFLQYPTFMWEGEEVIVVDPEESPDSGCRFLGNGKPTLVTLCQISPRQFLVLCPYGGLDDAIEKALDCYEELFGNLTVDDPPFETKEEWENMEGYLPISGGGEWLPHDDWSVTDRGLRELLKAAHATCHQWQHIKVSVNYQISTLASCEHGDWHDTGFEEDREYDGLQEVYEALKEYNAEPSSCPTWHPGVCYCDTIWRDCPTVKEGEESYTYHLEESLPEAWQRRLYDAVTA